MKDAAMRVRVEQELRDAFIAACQSQHIPAAQVLRQFMRGYVEQVKSKSSSGQGNTKVKKVGD